MSMFESRSSSQYATAMLGFLRLSRRAFDTSMNVTKVKRGAGRCPRYKPEVIKELEKLVNERARRSELLSISFGERYRIARDYLRLNDSEVGRHLGVSRELVRRWGENMHPPRKERLQSLAEFLDVPKSWLLTGCQDDLPADSHIGVRVGGEALEWREVLFALTEAVLGDLKEDAGADNFICAINRCLSTSAVMRSAARRSGGRWQFINGQLLFAAWIPLQLEPLKRRLWPDETEIIINEELARGSTTYGAWEAVRVRCEAEGLPYPKRITLHKRLQKIREHVEKYGAILTH